MFFKRKQRAHTKQSMMNTNIKFQTLNIMHNQHQGEKEREKMAKIEIE